LIFFTTPKLFKKLLLIAVILVLCNGLFAQKSIKKIQPSDLRFALTTYSFNDILLGNVKDPKHPNYTLLDLVDWCYQQKIEAMDMTGYYLPGYPDAPTDEYLYKLKKKCFDLGIDICGTGIRTNFASSDVSERKQDIERTKKWIIVASKLGAPVLRVFIGDVPEGYEQKQDEVFAWTIEALKQCAIYGKQHGVIIEVQNHGDLLKTAADCKKLINGVNSEWLGLKLDMGNFKILDPYKDIESVKDLAVSWQLKESVLGDGSSAKADYKRLIQIIKGSNYNGYIPIETVRKSKDYNPFERIPQFINELKTAELNLNP
jgi:sugar phosphate isomerase/epimerase